MSALIQGPLAVITGPITLDGVPVGGGLSYTEVTGTSQSAAVNSGYITNNASLVTVTLPGTFALGDIVSVTGLGAGGWKIAYASGDKITFLGVSSTVTTGNISSVEDDASVTLIGVVANDTWAVAYCTGNITVTQR